MSEELLVKHCAPTLAGLKLGNAFTCEYEDPDTIFGICDRLNKILNDRGVYIRILRLDAGRALVYVFRKRKLREHITGEEVHEFLEELGYDCSDVEAALTCLIQRVNSGEDFPHEIGIFLGYPLADVRGFIANRGKNHKKNGLWKVYGDEEGVEKHFAKCEKCTKVYCRKLQEGISIQKLTIVC